jgi:hypothetical protein
MRIVRGIGAEFGGRAAVTALVFIGVPVEMRHFGSGATARDHLDQLFTIENGLVQIGRLSRRARIAATIAIDPVAELAIGFVLEQALSKRRILCPHQIE